MSHERSAGAVIFFTHGATIEYLLLRYQAGHWDFPKGHIEKGESEPDTIRREVYEETGIEHIVFTPGFKEHISYFFRKSPKWFRGGVESRVTHRFDTYEKGAIFKVVTFYLARSRTKRVKLSSEHVGYTWLSYEDALRKLTFDNAKQILKKANVFLGRKRTDEDE